MGLTNWIDSVFEGVKNNTTKRMLNKASKSAEEPEILKKMRAIEKENKELDDIIKKYSK